MTLVAQVAADVSTKPRDATDSKNLIETVFRRPEARFRWDPHIAFILFLLSFLYLCLFRRATGMEPDEGIILQGAQRILAGQIPYRDFFSFYTPGSYYSLALLFRIFGSSVVVARTALALTGAILSLITYLLARRVCTPGVAVTMAALATVTSLPYRFLVLHNWDSTLWACLAIYSAVRLLEQPDLKWSFALGSFASLTMLFEQSKGAGLCLGLFLGFLAIFFIQRNSHWLNRAAILSLIFGLAWPFVITIGYFTSQHATHSMLADWLWPLQHYSQANRVPYGYQNWTDEARHAIFGSGSLPVRLITVLTISPCLWIPVLPLLAGAYLVYWILRARRKAVPDEKLRYYIIVTSSFVGMALTTVLARADILHFIYFQPLNCLVLAWLLDGRDVPGRFIKSARLYLFGYVVIAFLAVGLVNLLGAFSARQRLETRRGVVTTSGKDTVVEYVQNHVPAGETILVYPYLPLYYYLTGTFSPTPYDYFQSGMHTREQADEVVEPLASGRVKVVLFEIDFAEKIPHAWPNTPLTEIAHDPVTDYIVQNFHSCANLKSPDGWRFLFMVRKDLRCPVDSQSGIRSGSTPQ